MVMRKIRYVQSQHFAYVKCELILAIELQNYEYNTLLTDFSLVRCVWI